jgi:hypothetical protein
VSAFSQVRIAYRTPTQLGLLERFHETLKYEEVYWHLYDDPADARQKLAGFHERYNLARPHWALLAAEENRSPGPDPDAARSVRERVRRQPAVMVPVGRLAERRGPETGGSTPKQNRFQNFRLKPVARQWQHRASPAWYRTCHGGR